MLRKVYRVHRDDRGSTRGSAREKFEIAGSRAAGNESPVGMARLLIPSELRNPFPSNSLNCSASSFSPFALFLALRPPPTPCLFRLTFPGYIPRSARVGIQRPHNRLLTHSIFLPLSSRAHPPLSSLSLFFSYPLSALFSFHQRVWAASSIGIGMRSSPFHGRETRLRRKGGVKEGGESTREDDQRPRSSNAAVVDNERSRKARGRQRGRHNDWPFLGKV